MTRTDRVCCGTHRARAAGRHLHKGDGARILVKRGGVVREVALVCVLKSDALAASITQGAPSVLALADEQL
jgi:hypothetical protein